MRPCEELWRTLSSENQEFDDPCIDENVNYTALSPRYRRLWLIPNLIKSWVAGENHLSSLYPHSEMSIGELRWSVTGPMTRERAGPGNEAALKLCPAASSPTTASDGPTAPPSRIRTLIEIVADRFRFFDFRRRYSWIFDIIEAHLRSHLLPKHVGGPNSTFSCRQLCAFLVETNIEQYGTCQTGIPGSTGKFSALDQNC